MKTQALKHAKELIMKARNIVIAGHINPDGDCIGSLLALGLGIEQLGKNVHMVSYDGVPELYRFLPGADRVIKKTSVHPDLAIAVDCGSRELLGKTFDTFSKAKCVLEIDHHHFREPFGDASFVDHEAAAVGELVYKLLRELAVPITREVAMNILTSLIAETHSFRLPNVKPFTFELCARLVRTGIDLSQLAETVFWSKSKEAVIISGLCLSRCKFRRKGEIAWSTARRKDFDKMKAKDEHVQTVPGDMLSIKGVQVALFFKEEKTGSLRVSMRSKGKVNVADLARSFGGGGHFDSAGCVIPNSRDAMMDVLNRAEDLLK